MYFFNYGGGFQQKMNAQKFHLLANEVDNIPFSIEKASFSIDDSESYEGIHNPNNKWNGWEQPYFKIEIFEKILKDINEKEETYSFKKEDNEYFIR